MMYFEGRELKSYAEPASPASLREGAIYFSVSFGDEEMLIPMVEPVVFAGRDLEEDDSGQLYFQDVESYRKGVRYRSSDATDNADFLLESEDNLNLFEFEGALDVLMRCSLRRRNAEDQL